MARGKAKAAAGTHRIRTTINPGEVIEVGDAEFLDLTRQGLIFDGEPEGEPEENGAGESGSNDESTEG